MDKSSGKTCYKCNQKCKDLGICGRCKPKQSLDSIAWYSDYKNTLSSDLVKALKFDNTYAATKPMSSAISTISRISSIKNIIVSPVPTAGRRARKRGWDQSYLISKGFAKKEGLRFKSLLIRTSSFDQIGSTKQQRSEASKKFFIAHRKALINGDAIILIDDVTTTGSTLNSAAKVLKDAGAKEVHGLVFARQFLNLN